MKRLILSTLTLAIAAFIIALAPASKAKAPVNEKVVVEFPTKVKLLNVFLKGEYVFIHDDAKMARGEDCTWIYRSNGGQPGELILSFHCVPVERKQVDHFTVVTTKLLPDLLELKEYQFANSTEGHQVPAL